MSSYATLSIFYRRIDAARRRSIKTGRQMWIEMRNGRISAHVTHHRGWGLICRVIGTEVIY